MKFSAHGNIDYYIQNKCVINKPNAGFNKEGIDILFTSIVNSLREHQVAEWVLIEVLEKDALPTPAAKQALIDNYKMAQKHGCVKISAVCFNVLQTKFLAEVSKLSNIDIHFFTCERDALANNKDFL